MNDASGHGVSPMFIRPYVPHFMILVIISPYVSHVPPQYLLPSPVAPQTYITQSLCSSVPMYPIFPRSYVPQSLCSPVPIDVHQSLCSPVPNAMFPQLVPQSLCSPVLFHRSVFHSLCSPNMFPGAYVPYMCDQDSSAGLHQSISMMTLLMIYSIYIMYWGT